MTSFMFICSIEQRNLSKKNHVNSKSFIPKTDKKMKQISPLALGSQAPNFTLNDQNSNPVSLEKLKGKKILLYFYPKAMTPGCTTQACSLRDTKAEFEKLNTLVFGISPDPVARLEKFIQRDKLNFPLLSDEDHQIADAFGVWGEKKFMGKTYEGIHRISFLIDENGKIIQVFDKFKTKDHHQVVLDFISTL